MRREMWRIVATVLVITLLAGLALVSQGDKVWAGNTDTPLYEKEVVGTCADAAPYRVKVAGVGMFGRSEGTINLSLPSTATVYKAYLYWTGRDPYDFGDATVRFEGTTFQVGDAYTEKIGGPAFWATNDFAWAYRADVTLLVSPSKTSYTFTDPFAGDSDAFDIPYGAALVVIYQDSAESWPGVVGLWEGMDIAEGSSSPTGSEGIEPVVFTFEPAAENRAMTLTTVVGGIASGSSAQVYYLVGSGTPPSGDIYTEAGVIAETLPAAQDGDVMTTYDKVLTVPAGSEWVAVQVKSADTNGAQLHWIAQTFQMDAACPRVEVTKELVEPADGIAHVNDTVHFRITVRNTGNTNLMVVPLHDAYDPDFLDYASASPSPNGVDKSNGNLNWTDITGTNYLAPNATAVVDVYFNAIAGTQDESGDVTTNTATVSGATDQNNNTAPDDSDSADVEISNPSIAVTKERSLPVPPDQYATVGETVRFTITVTNTGDTILNTVLLTDTYDTNYLTFVTATPSPADSANDGELNWSNIGPLNPGDSTTVVVEFTAAQSTWNGSLHAQEHNYATVSAVDENNDVVGPEEDTAFVRITNPAVTITKTLVGTDTHVPIEGYVTYNIVVENTGDTELTTVPVVDTFPSAYLAYSSDTSGFTPTVTGNTITWSDITGTGSLAPGDSISFTVTFEVVASSNPDTITNTACVEAAEDVNGDNPDDVCDDDSTVVTTHPEVSITKVRTSSSPILVGDLVTFTLYITNTGDTTLSTVPVTDTYNTSYLNFVSASITPDNSDDGSSTDGDIQWDNVGPLAPGASTTIEVTFEGVASTTGIGGATENSACASGTDAYGDEADETCDSDTVGILSPAAIGDLVWLDANGNGIQDGGESGISGVTVRLYNSANTLIATTTTGGDGSYAFTHLYPGDYYVEFLAPAGYVFTAQNQGSDDAKDSDANPSTGKTAITTLSEGETDNTWDAGLYQPVTIGDYVWEDVNGDGIQNDGTAGIGGVTVKLYYAGPDGTFGTSDDTTSTTTTNNTGHYQFANLPPGTYKVEFITPDGYVITFQDEGSDDSKDSDPDRTTGVTAPFSVTSGQSDDTRDAGMYRPVSIGDFVWVDSNADGVQDAGESGLDGVLIRLYDGDDNLVAQTSTSGGGNYIFNNLPPGTYKVVAPDTHGSYVPTTSTTWGPYTLTSGTSRDDADFGYISPTAVQIASFQAEVTEMGVHLVWRTVVEENVDGFRVERALRGSDNWRAVAYLPAEGPGSTYSTYDSRVQPGFTYAYRIIVSPDGQAIGPWAVSVPKAWEPGAGIQGGYRVFMPLVSK